MCADHNSGGRSGIADEDDLNKTALCLPQSLYQLPSTRQLWIHYRDSDLQIHFLDKRNRLMSAQNWNRSITGLVEQLTQPPNEAQVIIDDQDSRPSCMLIHFTTLCNPETH